MWGCIVIFLGTVGGICCLRKRGYRISGKILGIMLVLQCIGIGVSLMDASLQKSRTKTVERNDPGEGESVEVFHVSGNGFTETVELELPEKKLSEQEVRQLFSAAEKEIDQTFFEENQEQRIITDRAKVCGEYQKGLVEASWNFDPVEVISPDGTVHWENVEEETPVQAAVTLYCQDYESTYTFWFTVALPAVDTEEGFSCAVKKALRKAKEDAGEEGTLVLPREADGVRLTWMPESNIRGIQIAILGTAAGLLLFWGEKQERIRNIRQENRDKQRDYADIVNSLSMFLGAGLSIRGAFGRIGQQYLMRRADGSGRRRAGFEEIVITHREMEDGTGEMEALRHLGERNSLREYRKLALLLQQNLKKGTKELLSILEREEEIAFEKRQHLAKQAGEEASAKLLLPMMGLLLMVLMILLVPAMMNIGI